MTVAMLLQRREQLVADHNRALRVYQATGGALELLDELIREEGEAEARAKATEADPPTETPSEVG